MILSNYSHNYATKIILVTFEYNKPYEFKSACAN